MGRPRLVSGTTGDTTLTVGYSTLAERAAGIDLPAPDPNVQVLVVVQGGAADIRLDGRSDVTVVHDDGLGAARSRNVVLDRAVGRYVLFADDDATPLPEGVWRAIEVLDADPGLAVLQGRAIDPSGRPRKRYPRGRTRLNRWNAGKVGTIELLVRREAVVSSGVRFDEGFGAGTDRPLGDEYIFVSDAVRAGLRGEFVPIDLAVHPAGSSGLVPPSDRDASHRAAVFDRVFGPTAPIARLAFVLRRPRRFGSVRRSVRFVVGTRALGPRAEPADQAA